MVDPFPGLYPVTKGEDPVAVQEKDAPGSVEVRGILEEFPEQMLLKSGLVVTVGDKLVASWTVSAPVHPNGLVTTTP